MMLVNKRNPGWFIDLESIPKSLEGFPVQHKAADEDGADGHLIIMDVSK